jgi:hypothetical protein
MLQINFGRLELLSHLNPGLEYLNVRIREALSRAQSNMLYRMLPKLRPSKCNLHVGSESEFEVDRRMLNSYPEDPSYPESDLEYRLRTSAAHVTG